MGDSLILTGFMGVGKTATGRELARLLGWEFVDLDREIERVEGRNIPEIFARSGEAHFRDAEFRVLTQVLGRDQTVVATGGGAILGERNRELLADRLVFYLYASALECLRRLERSRVERPLLAGEDREARVLKLYADREALYESCGRKITTEGLTPEEVAAVILKALGWEAARVAA